MKQQTQKEVKPLPRDEAGNILARFPANGRTYRILNPESDGFSIDRFNAWTKMGMIFGFGSGFAEQARRIEEAIAIANGVPERTHTYFDLVLALDAIRQGIGKIANERYMMAFHLCSIFIVREDEDLIHYDMDDPFVEEKIGDWNAEGYDAQDFLALAADLVIGFRGSLTKLTKKVEAASRKGEFTGALS